MRVSERLCRDSNENSLRRYLIGNAIHGRVSMSQSIHLYIKSMLYKQFDLFEWCSLIWTCSRFAFKCKTFRLINETLLRVWSVCTFRVVNEFYIIYYTFSMLWNLCSSLCWQVYSVTNLFFIHLFFTPNVLEKVSSNCMAYLNS